MWYDKTDAELRALRNSLKLNKKLKSLDLYGGLIFFEDFYFGNDIRLSSLSISQVEFQFQSSFKAFLETQKNSLEELNIGSKISIEIFNLVLSMPRLLKAALTFNGIESRGLPKKFSDRISVIESFPPNFSVKSLNLRNSWETCFTPWLNQLTLQAFPNLEHLKITTLDDGNSIVIPEACKSLKHLEVKMITAKNIWDNSFYTNLETFYSEKVDECSQKPFDELKNYYEKRNI